MARKPTQKLPAQTRLEMQAGKNALKHNQTKKPKPNIRDDGKPPTYTKPVGAVPVAEIQSAPPEAVPDQIKRQIELTEAFYKERPLSGLFKDMAALTRRLKVEGPLFQIATEGEAGAFIQALARLIEATGPVVAHVTRPQPRK